MKTDIIFPTFLFVMNGLAIFVSILNIIFYFSEYSESEEKIKGIMNPISIFLFIQAILMFFVGYMGLVPTGIGLVGVAFALFVANGLSSTIKLSIPLAFAAGLCYGFFAFVKDVLSIASN